MQASHKNKKINKYHNEAWVMMEIELQLKIFNL